MHVVLPAMMLKDDYLRRYEAVDIADADLDAFVTGKTAVSIFQDDFNTVSLRDNVDHDVDVLPFQTNATGDKYKSRAKDTRNDIFGV